MKDIDTQNRIEFLSKILGIELIQYGTGPYQEFGTWGYNPAFIISKFSQSQIKIMVSFITKNVDKMDSKDYYIVLPKEYFGLYIKEIFIPTIKKVYDLFYKNKITKEEQNKIIIEYNKKFEILNETTKIPIEIRIEK